MACLKRFEREIQWLNDSTSNSSVDDFVNNGFSLLELDKESYDCDMIKAFILGIGKFNFFHFETIIKEVIPSSDYGYRCEKWEMFRMMPLNYICTRSPDSQGNEILCKILQLGGYGDVYWTPSRVICVQS